MTRLALRFQAAYFIVSGLWPIVHLPSFELITGPKREDWLVKTFGLLTAVIGVVLWRASSRPEPSPDARLLAGASAASVAAVDVWYVRRGPLRPVYLLDAIVEVPFALVALVSLRGGQTRSRPDSAASS